MKRMLVNLLALALVAGFTLSVGCKKEEPGPMEKAGQKADKATKDAGKAVDKAADDMEDAADDMGE